VPSDGSTPCTHFMNTGDHSGSLARSRQGKLVSFACWGGVPAQAGQGTAAFPPSVYLRTIATLNQAGELDLTQGVDDAFGGLQSWIFSTLVDDSVTPNRYYWAGTISTAINGGLRTSVQDSRASTAFTVTNTCARCSRTATTSTRRTAAARTSRASTS
jgi:hypothetical protein